MIKKQKNCQYCEKPLCKDEVGLNKKLFEAKSKLGIMSCLACLAEILECSVEDLQEKIIEFKAQGCKLFS